MASVCARVRLGTGAAKASPRYRHNCKHSHRIVKVKALDSSQTIAVSQQLTAWAALVAGEGGWALQRLSPGTPGRPSLPITAVIAASMILVTVLFQFDGTQGLAEVIGMVSSAGAMAYYIKRCIDTTGAASDWPGPKAPVAGMVLVAFFALNICLQGLRS